MMNDLMLFIVLACISHATKSSDGVIACHLYPHDDTLGYDLPLWAGGKHAVHNGVLGCGECHKVFDKGLIDIKCEAEYRYVCVVHPSCTGMGHLQGKELRVPYSKEMRWLFPNMKLWEWRNEWNAKKREKAEMVAEKAKEEEKARSDKEAGLKCALCKKNEFNLNGANVAQHVVRRTARAR